MYGLLRADLYRGGGGEKISIQRETTCRITSYDSKRTVSRSNGKARRLVCATGTKDSVHGEKGQ